jgi:hypothetical protein
VGGDIGRVFNTRCIIGTFPWKFEGGETCPCRIIAVLDVGPLTVEEGQEVTGCRVSLLRLAISRRVCSGRDGSRGLR